MPPLVQTVVLLHIQAQLKYGEIGQILGVPLSSVKAAFFCTKRRLRTIHQLKDLNG